MATATLARAAWAAALALLAGVLVWPGITGEPGELGRQSLLFAAAWTLSQVLLYLGAPVGVLDVGVLYLLVFGLFHGGLLLAAVVRGPAEMPGWLTSSHAPEAVRLASIAMLVFAVVFRLGRLSWLPLLFPQPPAAAQPPHTAPPVPRPTNPSLGLVGTLVLLAGLVLFAMSILSGSGLDVLQYGYGEFVTDAGGSARASYATLFVAVGAVLTVAAGGPYRKAGWLGFALYAVVAFPLGTRGTVLFPLVALVALEARRGTRIRLPLGLALMLGLFSLISLVRTTRLTGVAGLFSGAGSASPLDAVAEMGHSLLPTVVVLDWHANGDSFRGGITLVAVPVRVLERLTGWHGGPPVVDGRLFNQEILMRVGPIGGSPVAEGYHNLGLAGVALLMGIIAALLGTLAHRRPGPIADALLGVSMVPLVTGIRNSAAPTATQILVGVAFVGAGWLLARGRPRPKATVDRSDGVADGVPDRSRDVVSGGIPA